MSESTRISVDEMYMRMAEVVAQRSYATRAKVGAIVVKDFRVLAEGYNGMISGFPNDELEIRDSSGALYTNPLGLHAESNAITKIAKYGGTGAWGGTMYCGYSCCKSCMKLIFQSGIKRFVYRELYRVHDHLDEFDRAKVELVCLPAVRPSYEEIEAKLKASQFSVKLVEAQRDCAEEQRNDGLVEIQRLSLLLLNTLGD